MANPAALDLWAVVCDGVRVRAAWVIVHAHTNSTDDTNYIKREIKYVKSKLITSEQICIMITGAQIRAARALLRWSARELALKSKVSLPTIQRMEGEDGVPSAYTRNLDAIQKTLESGGVEFIPENGAGDGVRFRQPRDKRAPAA